MTRESLPIDAVLPELAGRLRESGAVVLRAPTGAGKTTRVPPAIVGAKTLILLEPRRVAARAAAARMAAEHGSALGEYVGYHVRFDRRAGPRTRILAVTPGILLRLLLGDPFLEHVDAIVFDEFHERGLESDLALGMAKLLRENVRPDLRLVVMSATLDVGAIAAYLGDCPQVTSEGRTFPVEILYRPRRGELVEATAFAVRSAFAEHAGDLLAFLPGVREIRDVAARLADLPALVVPLYGDLPPEEQDRALRKQSSRRIVLATNVAETSVTVEGVAVVVDTGVARQLEFDASVGMDRLRLAPISRAAADQRAGRAGRTQAGVCVRLWDEPGHRARAAHAEPEIRRVDLAPAVLQLLALGEDAARFPWLEPPRAESVAQALQLLETLGAFDGTLTPLGKKLAELPVHPRLGRLLLEGVRLGVPERAAMAAALLSERDPYAGPTRPTRSDLLDRIAWLETANAPGTHAIRAAQKQLLRLLPPSHERGGEDELLRAIFAAYPDRLARRRERGDRRALLVGGRGVRQAPSSGVDAELFVAVDVDAGGVESFVRLASEVEREWLPREHLRTRHEVQFDPASEKLLAWKRTRFLDLVVEEAQGHFADEAEATRVLAEAAASDLPRVLPPSDSPAALFRARVACSRAWMPEREFPPLDEVALREMLPEVCRGKRSFAEVRANWLDTLRSRFTYAQQTLLDRELPERLEVPSGSEIALAYEVGRPPVLAVRIQELFGLAETPRVAGGRVRVLLHLLAPNYRPQQVTEDLASFWANTYPLVRKELRGRYPKHDWPENPLTAPPRRGPRRRGA